MNEFMNWISNNIVALLATLLGVANMCFSLVIDIRINRRIIKINNNTNSENNFSKSKQISNTIIDNGTPAIAISNVQNSNVNVSNNNEKIVDALNVLAKIADNYSQENISKIAEHVKNIMPKEEQNNGIPNETFMVKFIEEAKLISDDEIQKVWSSLFVHEAKNPNSVTIRALDTIKNMSTEEAKLFEKIAQKSLFLDYRAFLPKSINEEIPIDELTVLADIGLLKNNFELFCTIKANKGTKSTLFINNNLVLIFDNQSEQDKIIGINVYTYTKVGEILIKALNIKAKGESILKFANFLKTQNPEVKVSLHHLLDVGADRTIRYVIKDLLIP